jgi:hypothetical protein
LQRVSLRPYYYYRCCCSKTYSGHLLRTGLKSTFMELRHWRVRICKRILHKRTWYSSTERKASNNLRYSSFRIPDSTSFLRQNHNISDIPRCLETNQHNSTRSDFSAEVLPRRPPLASSEFGWNPCLQCLYA